MVHRGRFGVRYKTPVGPIRIDAALQHQPAHYNGFSEATASGAVFVSEQLPGIESADQSLPVFLSIGQAF